MGATSALLALGDASDTPEYGVKPLLLSLGDYGLPTQILAMTALASWALKPAFFKRAATAALAAARA